ncbi:MAG TPA: DUF4124 domain-containing protein [Burkholderiales bacterium]|nr:DUF4124 domain-containing protein [Burkholderiales bacterium]
MKLTAKPIVAACALLLSPGLAAQTYKCVDEFGKITYSGKKCSELGLKDAGEVKDRLNINPALPTASPPATPGRSSDDRPSVRAAPAPAARAPEIPETPAAPEEPAQPERRCFVVNTPKGKVTRCNDVPD